MLIFFTRVAEHCQTNKIKNIFDSTINCTANILLADVAGNVPHTLIHCLYISLSQAIVLSSQKIKFIWFQTFSHYLGLKHYRNQKKIMLSDFQNF